MPTTEQQRRAIAYLTRTSRDTTHNAPAFDEPGIMAALGKVAHLDAGTVTMAAMRCAADPSIKTPAMIGDPSSSVYRERVGPERARRNPRPLEACAHCGGEFGPACCDKPSQRPEPGDNLRQAAEARELLRSRTGDAMGDPCPTCDHAWHGLRCRGHVYRYEGNPYLTSPCLCPGPWGNQAEETPV